MNRFDVTISLAVNGRCQLTVPADQAAAVRAALAKKSIDWRSEDGFSFGQGGDLRRVAVFITSGVTGAELAGLFDRPIPRPDPEPALLSMACPAHRHAPLAPPGQRPNQGSHSGHLTQEPT